MADYLHGAYASFQGSAAALTDDVVTGFVYVGTAPVHTVDGGSENVNKAIVVHNIAEARKYFGYVDDFANYTLCEAMKKHLIDKQVGPIVLINVLNPATHKEATGGTVSLTPTSGRIVIADAGNIVQDSIVIKTQDEEPVTKVKGTDYYLSYNAEKKVLSIVEATSGALGTAALTITYDIIKPAAVVAADVIGATDDLGSNTGVYAIRNVYPLTGIVPAFFLVPGFSGIPAVHAAMASVTEKINGHWDAYMLVDLPLSHDGTAITMQNAATWKTTNGYNKENETVYFPMVDCADGYRHHISVLAAANLQELLLEQDGVPYKTASNTECPEILNLYMGESNVNRVFDDKLINSALNENGIASAVFTGGRWVIWGAHSADYTQTTKNEINIAETNRMMLYYICNDFQARRSINVDKPISVNALQAIVSEEQARLDALVNIGALLYGNVQLNATAITKTDLVEGDWTISFEITTTPLMKSLTAIAHWTDDGFAVLIENLNA